MFQSALLDVVTHLSSSIQYGQELGLSTRSICGRKMGIFQKKEGMLGQPNQRCSPQTSNSFLNNKDY